MENEEIRLVLRCLDCFASLAGDKESYTLYPKPYRWCAHVSTIENNELRGQMYAKLQGYDCGNDMLPVRVL